MATLAKKTQILFSEEQLELLKKIAEEKATSVGALIRIIKTCQSLKPSATNL